MTKEKQIFDKIKRLVIDECQHAFQYCGVADSDTEVVINTGNEDTLKIKIEIIPLGTEDVPAEAKKETTKSKT